MTTTAAESMSLQDKVTVCWHLAISGSQCGSVVCHKSTTLSQLAKLIGIDQINIVLCGSVYAGHAETPFLHISTSDSEETKVEVDVVVTDNWPNPTRAMRWKNVDVSDENFDTKNKLLRAVIELGHADEFDGVRCSARIQQEVKYVVDGSFLFVELSRAYDVWIAFLGNLAVNGVATEPKSVWLYADLHTPLQPVSIGSDFEIPVVAAQYTTVHLRFELEDLPRKDSPFRLDFDASIAIARREPRRVLSQTDHVSKEGWALSKGAVAYSIPPLSLHAPLVTVLGNYEFSMPSPHSYEYSVSPAFSSEDVEAKFVGLENQDFFIEDSWYRSRCEYSGLSVRVERNYLTKNEQPWQFALYARRRLDRI
jgi:hypothetical protein